MECVIEVYDTAGRRVGSFDAPPLLEATRNGPDGADVIRGLAPVGLASLGAGYTVRLLVEGALFCAGTVRWTGPAWGDTKRLVIDRYVSFRELLAFEARGARRAGNTWVSRRYVNTRVSGIVRDLLERAPGPVHGTVAHGAYPEGAAREWAKFVARRTRTEALAVGGIDAGQWVDGARIDARGAWAKDGVTIAGLVVDGAAWPDLRLMMVDAEEPSLNARAVARHPETADWTAGAYAASGYALRGAASREALQALLDGEGIDGEMLRSTVETHLDDVVAGRVRHWLLDAGDAPAGGGDA